MDHAGKAQNLFREGYNCAQAVAGAFSEELGMDPALAMRLVAGFGGGMGRLREVCGAVSGVVFVLSMKYGYSGPKDQQAKTELYRKVQAAGEAFAAENGSMICRELLQGQGGRGGDPSPRSRIAEYRPVCPAIPAEPRAVFLAPRPRIRVRTLHGRVR